MAPRNYYVVLGVTRGATPDEIRSAYREHAKALHPDRAGDDGTGPFQELSEAYATLSDPARRREYDRAMESEREAARPARASSVSPGPDPFSVLHGETRYGPSLDAIRDRFVRDFSARHVPKAERAEGLNLEVVLSSEEAFRGVVLPIDVPTLDVCLLRIPPGVRPGSLFEVPLDHLGIHHFYLRVHVFVDDRLTQAG